MNKLMNSAMMPSDGHYFRRMVTQAEFVAAMAEGFESSIGYPATAQFLERISGRSVPLSREETTVEDGDKLLICKLKYRLQNPGNKRDHAPRDEDYEFIIAEYRR
jgi:Domain of unknown function (DUF1874)